MAAYLAVTAGLPARVLRLDEAGSFVAGRAPDCALVLTHPEVSRYHCQFSWNGRTCTVEDLSSRRGTLANGEPVDEQAVLRSGDKIGIGPIVVEFNEGAAPAGESDEPVPASSSGRVQMFVLGKISDRIAPASTAETTLGRDPRCDAELRHPGVSRRHASIRMLPTGGCVVTDLHSTAGSFVNGHRFDSHELTVGDRLQIGPFSFRFDGRALMRTAARPGTALRTAGLRQTAGDAVLLDDVSLEIQASQFIGILGPSGAGKSTLLETLAGLRRPAAGRVFVDGADLYAGGNLPFFGLVPQEDTVHRELTVAQALRFSARLRLPAATPELEIRKLIVQTMDQLGVRAQADMKIARLSGGQRKRVCVAVELLSRPAALFLDEPSSGLDPATECQLMETLRELTNIGCTVVCTTHVMENAYLMDELILLAGGCLAFVGTAQETRAYFGVSRLPALYEQLRSAPAGEWKEKFAERRHAREETAADPVPPEPPIGSPPRTFALPILLGRQWAILAADRRNFSLLLGQPLAIAVLVAWVTSEQSLALFFAYLATLWFGCSNAAQEIVKEAPIYRRERLIGVTAHSYLAGKYLFLFAVTAAQALILYGCLLAGLGGTDGSTPWQIAALLGSALAAVGIGSAISAWVRSVMQAVLVVPLVLIPQILFSGSPTPASEMRPLVYLAARPMPAFAAQTLMDGSFLWKKPIAGGLLSAHRASFLNINRISPMRTGEVFEKRRPMLLALTTQILWALLTYAAAWLGLRWQARSAES